MSVRAVVGINWGDEGKGRMIDLFAETADAVVRYQGGNNAGHTVINPLGEFKLHLIPSGIFNPKTLNILGPGTVINLEALVAEMQELKEVGIPLDNLRISERAMIVLPYQQWEDVWEEERLGKKAYGSTRQGIAPAYGDRYLKKGLLMGELRDMNSLRKRLSHILEWKNVMAEGVYGKKNAVDLEDMMTWLEKWSTPLMPHVTDTNTLLDGMAAEGKTILFEAQLGALRDIYYGIYPMTTSSSTLAAHAPIGGGLLGHPITETVGVMKAFSTCVGAGPFVTEWFGEEADAFRVKSGEFGATTGRPRRIGPFDAVASRYGCKIQGATSLALTKLDNLSGEQELKICTAYMVNGKEIEQFPMGAELEAATPVYETMQGWSEDVSTMRTWDELPKAAQDYVLRIEELMGVSIDYVSVGPERDALITRAKTQMAA